MLKRLLESFNFKSSQFSSLKCQMLPDRGNYAASNIYNLLCSAVTALCAFFRVKLKTSSNRQTGFGRELFFDPSQPMLIECLLFVVKEIEKKRFLVFFQLVESVFGIASTLSNSSAFVCAEV